MVLASSSSDEAGGVNYALLGGGAGLALLTMAATGLVLARRRSLV